MAETTLAADGAGVLVESCVPHEVDVPLGPLTWYGVGGRAEAVAHPRSVEELVDVTRACHERGVPMRVLGDGANLLVLSRGVPGVVVRLDAPAFCDMRIDASRGTLRAGGGLSLMKLVRETAKRGLGGLEGVAGIPASVGGGVRMNAGGAFGDVGSRVSRVLLVTPGGEVCELSREELRFGYRSSSIPDGVIAEVWFDLQPGDAAASVERFKQVFAYKSSTQPMGARSAGCAFKNPSPSAGVVAGEASSLSPPSAGRLIDGCGLKGYRQGAAYISTLHANFVVVDDPKMMSEEEAAAAADDVLHVIEHIQHEVAQRTGETLVREVVVWP